MRAGARGYHRRMGVAASPPLAPFHPLVAEWFARAFAEPTAAQEGGWPPIAAGDHTLILAPTGSGKTLAAFLWAINTLVADRLAGRATGRLLYLSPLKALDYDVERNLRGPLAGSPRWPRGRASSSPISRSRCAPATRRQRERQRMLRTPPDILITTPESPVPAAHLPRRRDAARASGR